MDREKFLEIYLDYMAHIENLIEIYKIENELDKDIETNILLLLIIVLMKTDPDMDDDDIIELFKLSLIHLDELQEIGQLGQMLS